MKKPSTVANAATTLSGLTTCFHSRTPHGTCGLTGRLYHSGCPCPRIVTTPVPLTPGGSYSIASLKPSPCSCFTRALPSCTISSFVPKLRQPVGHALMHAGSRPTSTRPTHSVHLAILPVVLWNFGTSNG